MESWTYEDEDGTLLGQQITPLDRVGIYVAENAAKFLNLETITWANTRETLGEQAKSVTLVDIAEKMLEQARIKVKKQKLKNLHLIQQDLVLQPLEQTFDLIIVSRVLHHMPHLDSSLAMFKKHLTLGGQLFIADYTVPDGENHGFIISELEETLENHGFSDIQTQILYSSDNLFLDKPSQLFLTSAIR